MAMGTEAPRIGLVGACACVALVAAGAGLLAALGAPPRLLIVNAAGLVVALGVCVMVLFALSRTPALVVAGIGLALMLATALWGFALEDVRRWVQMGPFTIHAGYVLAPPLLAAISRLRAWAPICISGLCAVLWLQPDAGVATGVALSAIAMAAAAPSRWGLAGVSIAAVGAAATWTRPDPLAPAMFVEHVAELAWSHHPALGVLAFTLLALIPAPFLWLGRREAERRVVFWAMGGFWGGVAVASLAGHFPTPILGAGVGPIIGYALAWTVCLAPPRAR